VASSPATTRYKDGTKVAAALFQRLCCTKDEAAHCAIVVLRTMVASSRRSVVRGGTSVVAFSWLPCNADLR